MCMVEDSDGYCTVLASREQRARTERNTNVPNAGGPSGPAKRTSTSARCSTAA